MDIIWLYEVWLTNKQQGPDVHLVILRRKPDTDNTPTGYKN